MNISLRSIRFVLGAAFSLTLFACAGFGSNGAATAHIKMRVSNFSTIPALSTTLSSETVNIQHTSTDQAIGVTNCTANFLGTTIENSTLTLFTSSASQGEQPIRVDSTEGIYSCMIFGNSPTPSIENINSAELPGPYRLFVSDLSISNSTNYNVFIIDVTAGTSVMTSPVQGVDHHRTVAYAVPSPSTYRVELRDQITGAVFIGCNVVIDSSHQDNIVAFTDNNTNTGFVPRVIHGDDGCVAP